jgi:hypothetical protein
MTVDGTWSITISTPMGKQKATVDLVAQGGTVTGTAKAMGNAMDVQDGRFADDRLTFATRVAKPLPMTLEFDLAVAGDSLDGTVVAGPMGRQKVTGERL